MDFGIDDDVIKQTRDQITPGTSGLFLFSSGAVTGRALPEFQGMGIEVASTNLSNEDEEKLKTGFSEEQKRQTSGLITVRSADGPTRRPACPGWLLLYLGPLTDQPVTRVI